LIFKLLIFKRLIQLVLCEPRLQRLDSHLLSECLEPLEIVLLLQYLRQQNVVIVLLRQVLYLELRILLHKRTVLIVDSLSYLSHRIQVLIQLLFSLLKVIVILLLLVLLGFQLLLDIVQLVIQGRPNPIPLLYQHPRRQVLHLTYVFLKVLIL